MHEEWKNKMVRELFLKESNVAALLALLDADDNKLYRKQLEEASGLTSRSLDYSLLKMEQEGILKSWKEHRMKWFQLTDYGVKIAEIVKDIGKRADNLNKKNGDKDKG